MSKKPGKKPKKNLAKKAENLRKGFSELVSTRCPNCNLRLAIPKVESHRCILCKCKELEKQAWTGL
jgi:hypothetical protein